jgi:hypothetical protein
VSPRRDYYFEGKELKKLERLVGNFLYPRRARPSAKKPASSAA